MSKLTQDAKGNESSMRVVLLWTTAIGIITILTGLVGWLGFSKPDAPLVIGSGTGVMALVAGAKAWQAQSENKDKGE